MCGGDPSHEQVVRHHDQEEISQVGQHGGDDYGRATGDGGRDWSCGGG